MKKVITVLLVLALAITAVTAANIKVGAELGYGVDIFKATKMNDGEKEFANYYLNRGIAANLTGEYDFNDSFGVKLSAGIMYAFKPYNKYVASNNEGKYKKMDSAKNSGLYFDVILDAKYSFNLNEKFALSALAGVELVSGHYVKYGDKNVDKKTNNVGIGLNVGAEVSYMIIDNLYINGGVSGSWMFVNINKYKEFLDITACGTSTMTYLYKSFYIRPYVGAQYAF